MSKRDRTPKIINLPECPKFVNTGFKSPINGWKSSEELDKWSVNNEMLQLWKDKGIGRIEELEGLSVKTYSYYPEELEDKRSWICQKCICHERCQGYYFETVGLDFDMSNPDLFDSLRRKCECKTCKHSLDLGRNLK